MQIGLRQFSHEDIEWFTQAVNCGDYSRYGLAVSLCERTNWRNKKGKLCAAQAGKILAVVADKLGVELPPVRFAKPQAGELPEYDKDVKLRCTLAQLGEVSVELVACSDSKQWRSMMHTHHPRGVPAVPGKVVKYWLVSERFGRVGGVSFHAASWHDAARDKHIGWSQRARVANLEKVLNNSRFLILPQVRVHGLASKALGLAAGRVANDWSALHGEVAVLLYTYVDHSHSGESYRTADWQYIGETSGRLSDDSQSKGVFAYPLVAEWREQLSTVSGCRFHLHPDPYLADDAHWTEVEYGASTHPDGRVQQRILSMGYDWQRELGEAVPRIFPNEAKRKAAYRLLSNKKVSMDDILESHRQATVGRCGLYRTVLAVQDTTTLNYDGLKNSTRGLTTIGGHGQGIFTHTMLAVSEGGRPLGVLDIDGEIRTRCADSGDEVKESIRWIEGLDTAGALSAACGGNTRVINVSDRESDLWKLFERQSECAEQVGVLVRCNGSRQRKVIDGDGEAVDLRAHVESGPKVSRRTVLIEAQGGKRARKKRKAKVALRIAKVNIKAPGKCEDRLPLVAVSVIEEPSSAKNNAPLNWLLLCSEGSADAASARRICQWYEKRWSIEEYFRVLKSGAQVEERRFDDADDLLKCLAFDAITAWRVFDLQRLAKYEPERLASEFFDATEIRLLRVLLHRVKSSYDIRPPPKQSIADFTVDLGRIAGFTPRKSQPIPGTKILWIAMKKLMEAVNTYTALQMVGMINDDVQSSVGS